MKAHDYRKVITSTRLQLVVPKSTRAIPTRTVPKQLVPMA